MYRILQTTPKVLLVAGSITALLAVATCLAEPTGAGNPRTTFHQPGKAGEPTFEFRRKGLWGFLDINGRIAIPPKYRHATAVRNGRAIVWSHDNVSIIDISGTIVGTLPETKYAWWASDDRIWLQDPESRLYSLYDADGNQVVPPKYQEVRSFYEGFSAVTFGGQLQFPGFFENAKHQYIDRDGNNVFGKTFTDIVWDFHEGYAVADDSIINKDGKVVFARPRGYKYQFSQGWIAVGQSAPPTSTDYLDTKGRVQLRIPYRGSRFSEGLAAFAVRDSSIDTNRSTTATWRWGYLDREGNQVIAPTFTSAAPFHDILTANRTVGNDCAT